MWDLKDEKPEAQFPSAVPPDDEQVSDDWQVPNITVEDFAVDNMVHWLKLWETGFIKTLAVVYFMKTWALNLSKIKTIKFAHLLGKFTTEKMENDSVKSRKKKFVTDLKQSYMKYIEETYFDKNWLALLSSFGASSASDE